MKNEPPSPLQRSITLGAQLAGSGIGAAGGAMTGDPLVTVLAVLTGTTIAEVGTDFVSRFLSPRQEARVGALFLSAGAAIVAKEVQGRSIRNDGFWQGDPSHGSEFAEGVMLAAIDCFEERKLPYLANLLANVAVSNLTAPVANYALRTAEKLSWQEMCLLALTMRPEDFPLGDGSAQRGNDWPDGIVKRAWLDLTDGSKLLMHPRITGSYGQPSWDLRMSAVLRTSTGVLVSELMELEHIPRGDLEPVWVDLLTVYVESPREAEQRSH